MFLFNMGTEIGLMLDYRDDGDVLEDSDYDPTETKVRREGWDQIGGPCSGRLSG